MNWIAIDSYQPFIVNHIVGDEKRNDGRKSYYQRDISNMNNQTLSKKVKEDKSEITLVLIFILILISPSFCNILG
jgi:hypothetical protein